MPILRYTQGDLVKNFKAKKYDAMAHGCNCFNTMGAGIARDVFDDLNGMYRQDLKTKEGDREKLGTFSKQHYQVSVNPKRIVIGYNAYTQFTHWDPKDMLSYEAVLKCFEAINKDLVDFFKHRGVEGQFKVRPSLGIPLIGCGLARGDWSIVENLINRATPDIDVEVVIWDKETNPLYLSLLGPQSYSFN